MFYNLQVYEQAVYSVGHDSWPLEESAQLADGPIGCGEMARGGSY